MISLKEITYLRLKNLQKFMPIMEFIKTDDELKEKLTDDEYFDFKFEKRSEELKITFIMGDDNPCNDYSEVCRDVYMALEALAGVYGSRM